MQGDSSYVRALSRRSVLAMFGGLVLMTAGCDEDPPTPQDASRRVQVTPATRPTGPSSSTEHRSAPTPSSAGLDSSARAAGDASSPSTPSHPGTPSARPRSSTPATSHAAPAHGHTSTAVKRFVPSHHRQIALTLDDGPAPYWTQRILDLLERYDVTATFCMVGRNVSERPDLARMVADRGHQLANHTWDHANLTRMSTRAVTEEIERTQAVLHHVTGTTARYFRAPYGAWTHSVTTVSAEHGLRPLGWSVDPQDWTRPPVSKLVARLLADITPGAIVLEHDGGGDRSHTLAALSTVIPRLLDEGYRFVTP